MATSSSTIHTQKELLLNNLMEYYKDKQNLNKMMKIINGESKISLRIVDWFVTNYAKKYYTVYEIKDKDEMGKNGDEATTRFKVYNEYKLSLKAYRKALFDPFCRWERITIPYSEDKYMETTLGQLNFFKWAIENDILKFIETNYEDIERDMNTRNSTSKRKEVIGNETRKKREELSVSACKCIKKETVKIVVRFN
jgi:hypothetical protein